jgi:hypothetical protein
MVVQRAYMASRKIDGPAAHRNRAAVMIALSGSVAWHVHFATM